MSKTAGDVLTQQCLCQSNPVWMKLIEDPRPPIPPRIAEAIDRILSATPKPPPTKKKKPSPTEGDAPRRTKESRKKKKRRRSKKAAEENAPSVAAESGELNSDGSNPTSPNQAATPPQAENRPVEKTDKPSPAPPVSLPAPKTPPPAQSSDDFGAGID